MKYVLIREGSAAKNFEVLLPLIEQAPDRVMFALTIGIPDDLIRGHINQLVSGRWALGIDPLRC